MTILLQTLMQAIWTWGALLLLLVGSVFVGLLYEWVVIRLVKQAVKATKTQVDDLILRVVHPPLAIVVVVATAWLGARYLVPIPPEADAWISNLAAAALVFLVALIVSRLAAAGFEYRARSNFRWRGAARLGTRLVNIAIYLVAFMVILAHYGVNITPLLTSLGLVGLAVALALQDTLANFFAGIWIQTGRALQPGHYVRLESEKLEGYVEKIGWRTTQIRTLPNNMIVMPNSRIAQSTITDYHLPTPRMALLIPISVGLEQDARKVERILVEEAKRAAGSIPGLLKDPEPFVRLIPGFGEYALQFTLICQVAEYTDQYLAQHELRHKILERFRAEGIRIPFPTRETIYVPGSKGDGYSASPATHPRP